MFNEENTYIYNTYKNKVLFREFSSDMINRIVRDNNHDNIYIMKSYKKNDDGTYNDEIDTIYEIYISLHSDQRSDERDVKNVLSNIDTCLECVPVEALIIPDKQMRHIVFDVFTNLDRTDSLIQIPCLVSAKTPTKLTQALKKQYSNANVQVCDVIVKTVVKLHMPEYSQTDASNNAIHIPVSADGKCHSLENTQIICDIPQVIQLAYKYIKPQRKDSPDIIQYARNLNNRKQFKFRYNKFFEALHNVNFINYPFYSKIIGTFPKTQDVKLINDVDPNNPGKGFDNWMAAFNHGFNIQNSPVDYDNKRYQQSGFKTYDNGGKLIPFRKQKNYLTSMTDKDIKRWYAPSDFKMAVAMDKHFNGNRWYNNRQRRVANSSATPKQSIDDITASIYGSDLESDYDSDPDWD